MTSAAVMPPLAISLVPPCLRTPGSSSNSRPSSVTALTTPTVSRTSTPEVVRENSFGVSNSLKALRSGLHRAVTLRRFLTAQEVRCGQFGSDAACGLVQKHAA